MPCSAGRSPTRPAPGGSVQRPPARARARTGLHGSRAARLLSRTAGAHELGRGCRRRRGAARGAERGRSAARAWAGGAPAARPRPPRSRPRSAGCCAASRPRCSGSPSAARPPAAPPGGAARGAFSARAGAHRRFRGRCASGPAAPARAGGCRCWCRSGRASARAGSAGGRPAGCTRRLQRSACARAAQAPRRAPAAPAAEPPSRQCTAWLNAGSTRLLRPGAAARRGGPARAARQAARGAPRALRGRPRAW